MPFAASTFPFSSFVHLFLGGFSNFASSEPAPSARARGAKGKRSERMITKRRNSASAVSLGAEVDDAGDKKRAYARTRMEISAKHSIRRRLRRPRSIFLMVHLFEMLLMIIWDEERAAARGCAQTALIIHRARWLCRGEALLLLLPLRLARTESSLIDSHSDRRHQSVRRTKANNRRACLAADIEIRRSGAGVCPSASHTYAIISFSIATAHCVRREIEEKSLAITWL